LAPGTQPWGWNVRIIVSYPENLNHGGGGRGGGQRGAGNQRGGPPALWPGNGLFFFDFFVRGGGGGGGGTGRGGGNADGFLLFLPIFGKTPHPPRGGAREPGGQGGERWRGGPPQTPHWRGFFRGAWAGQAPGAVFGLGGVGGREPSRGKPTYLIPPARRGGGGGGGGGGRGRGVGPGVGAKKGGAGGGAGAAKTNRFCAGEGGGGGNRPFSTFGVCAGGGHPPPPVNDCPGCNGGVFRGRAGGGGGATGGNVAKGGAPKPKGGEPRGPSAPHAPRGPRGGPGPIGSRGAKGGFFFKEIFFPVRTNFLGCFSGPNFGVWQGGPGKSLPGEQFRVAGL